MFYNSVFLSFNSDPIFHCHNCVWSIHINISCNFDSKFLLDSSEGIFQFLLSCTHHHKRDRLMLKLLFLIQWYFIQSFAFSEYSGKNKCSGYNTFNECHLFVSEYSGTGLKNYWIRNNNFNISLSFSECLIKSESYALIWFKAVISHFIPF